MFKNKKEEVMLKENREYGDKAEDFLLTSLTYNLGFIKGFSDTKKIRYCPQCGKKKIVYQQEGIVRCEKCQVSFGVVPLKERKGK